jgi:hypothetical protein
VQLLLTRTEKAIMQHTHIVLRWNFLIEARGRRPPYNHQKPGVEMANRPLSLSYLFFYLLLSPDTWRILFGFIGAVVLGPMLTESRNLGQGGETMVWLMIMAIGWSVTGWPAKKITGALQRTIKRAAL